MALTRRFKLNKVMAGICLCAGILIFSPGISSAYAGTAGLLTAGAARVIDGTGSVQMYASSHPQESVQEPAAQVAASDGTSASVSDGVVSSDSALPTEPAVTTVSGDNAPAAVEHVKTDEIASAGAAGVEHTTQAVNTVTSIMEGTVSENGMAAVEMDDEHEQALAIVEGRDPEETIAGYKDLGIAKVDNWLNVRDKASEEGELVGKMPKNAGCEILEIDGEWAHIKSGRVDGYSKLEYLYTGDEAKNKAREVIKLMATVTTTTLFVREEPSTESSVITMVPMEEELEVVEELDEWCKIAIDDEEGYISKEYVNLAEKLDHAVTMKELKASMGYSDTRIGMVNYAKQFLGNKYVWGGTSLTNGTDCSGFTMGIYKKYGIKLPRVSRAQATVGTKVTVAELKPGDLVFYGKGSYINHVAMYIGNGQVIHASSRKTGIKISNVGYRTPITCRRILND